MGLAGSCTLGCVRLLADILGPDLPPNFRHSSIPPLREECEDLERPEQAFEGRFVEADSWNLE